MSDPTSSGAQAATAEIRAAAGRLVAANRAAVVGAEAAQAAQGDQGADQGGQGAGQTDVPAMAQAIATQAMEQPAVSLTTVQAGAAAGQIPTGFVRAPPA